MPIIQCALMCHAPIVIPAIGGSRAPQCEGTTVAMRQVAAGIVAAEPDVLVIVSPHTPRQGSAWGIAAGRQLRGDFGRFGHPEVAVGLPGAPDAAAEVVRAAEAAGLRCAWLPPQLLAALDHGALVPLHFLAAAGFSGPTLLVSLPMPGAREHARFGAALSSAADAAEQRWVVLASGDMSHRVIEGAPAGFHPRGKVFDAGFRAALQAGDGRAAVSPDPSLRELAAEDVVDSTAVALGAADFRMAGSRVLHYAAPFGVGYLEAVLFDAAQASASTPSSAQGEGAQLDLLAVARQAIAAHLAGTSPEATATGADDGSCGVFVTLRDAADGSLRGCIGHMQPQHASLRAEVMDCAIAAATRDPRFEPVAVDELPRLRVELSLLGATEPVQDLSALDPRRYGVQVTGGGRRGVLLPDIPGVDSAEAQIRFALRKAGLAEGAPYELSRFAVQKLVEPSR